MIRAVIYARYSSAGQREESIEGQLRDCRRYAKQNGWSVVREYCDKAISGTTDNRPEFQRMIADCSQGIADVVICWKVDRFARNRMLAAIYREDLKKHGVKLTYAMEAIPDEPMGIVIESLMEGYAEFYSANLSQNIKRGNRDSALKHQAVGVRLFGYDVGQNKQFVVDEDEARWVRYIYDSVIRGATFQSIETELKRNAVKNKKGNPINSAMIRRMIENPKYKGTYCYGEIVDEDGMPAIVSKEQWAAAQERLKVVTHSPRNFKKRGEDNFILSGRLFCGNCGGRMVGDSGVNCRGHLFSYYSCQHKKRGHTCNKRSVRKDLIEDKICRALWEFISSPDNTRRIVDTAMEIQMQRQNRSTLALIEKEIANVKRKRNNIIHAIEEGVTGLGNRMNELNAEIERLTDEKSAEEFKIGATVSRDELVGYIEAFQVLGYPDDLPMKEKLVRAFLKKAVLYDDRVEIFFDCNGLPITIGLNEETDDCNEFDYQNISSTKKKLVEQWKIVVLL